MTTPSINQLLSKCMITIVSPKTFAVAILRSFKALSNLGTGNNQFSGNDRFNGHQTPDHFFRYIRRYLYFFAKVLTFHSNMLQDLR